MEDKASLAAGRNSGCRYGWVLLAGMLGAAFVAAPIEAGERLVLEVREVAGLRRHEPVYKLIKLPTAVPRETAFRLTNDGALTAAQFRQASVGSEADQWWVDFSAILGPFEKQTYVVEYGKQVQPLVESPRGHVLRQTREAFEIENAPYITWTVPRDLRGLLRSVNFPPNEHLRTDSPGLVLVDRKGGRHPLSGPGVKAEVIRQGTRAVALRFTGSIDRGVLSGVRWATELTFPSPVSWVEVDYTLEDRDARVAAIGLELNLGLDAPSGASPTLVDVGAWTQVYTSLVGDELIEMRAAPGSATALADARSPSGRGVHGAGGRCTILRGRPGQLVPFASNSAAEDEARDGRALSAAPEGWLHVMDRKRCLAVAVDRFAQEATERMVVSAGGSVGLWREFGENERGRKRWRGWLHFVHYPPQFSAGSSPRMMQTLPVVEVKGSDGQR